MRIKSLGVNLLNLGSHGADRSDPGVLTTFDPQYSIQSTIKLHVIGGAVKRAGRE
jgi:hypothetical protein